MAKNVSAESRSHINDAASLQQINEIRPCAPRHDVVSSVTSENHPRPLRYLAVVFDVQ